MTLDQSVELFMAGRLDEARRACRKLLDKRADLVEAHVLLAEIHRQAGDDGRARESIARALKLRPGWTEGHVHLAIGDLFADFGRHADAQAAYRRALERQPGLADARFNLASSLNAEGRTDETIAELQALLAADPGATDAREQLVHLLQAQRRFDEMEAACRAGPRTTFFQNKLGVALWWRGRHDEALAAYRNAGMLAEPRSEAHESAKLLEASALLTLGRYGEGWEAYRWRRTRRVLRASHPELIDDPRTIAAGKRIRILCEQGLGDELFFLRFAPALGERGHRLGVSGNPRLTALVPFLENDADFTLASGDLPLASGLDFAPPLPLAVDPARRAAIEAQLRAFGPPPYIAVTWRAGVLPDEPKPQGALYWVKDIPAELLGQALCPVDARVIVLQRRPQPEDLRRFTEALGRDALDLSQTNDDLRDAVAVLSVVDDYIGVSNTNMHLRAGLGKRARVLVLTPPEWRWGLEGASSPWFPDFTLYRQRPGRDWSETMGELAAALQQK
ncbi:MAG TPA: tetratricopeptide repeat protein [Burkholderiales bacterium]|nr:tetratricopeptide repeat protein [Burkholderiales bacterium]